MSQGKIIFRKGLKVFFVSSVVFALIFLITAFAIYNSHTGTERIQEITTFVKKSFGVMFLRWGIYAVIYFGWTPIVTMLSASKRRASPELTDEAMEYITARSRKIILVVICFYELMCWFQFFN